MHGLRGAARVHHDVGAAEFRDGGEHVLVHCAGGDVVDDVGAGLDAGAGDGGVEGVDAEDEGVEGRVGADVFDGGEDAGEFVGGGEGGGVRAGGLAADVEDWWGGFGSEEAGQERVESGGVEGRGVDAIVGEGVGG